MDDWYKPFRQIIIGIDLPTGGGYVFPGNRIVPDLLVFVPIDPDAAALPDWKVVEVDAALEEDLVLESNALAFEVFAGL